MFISFNGFVLLKGDKKTSANDLDRAMTAKLKEIGNKSRLKKIYDEDNQKVVLWGEEKDYFITHQAYWRRHHKTHPGKNKIAPSNAFFDTKQKFKLVEINTKNYRSLLGLDVLDWFKPKV